MMSPHDKRCIAKRALKRNQRYPLTHTGRRLHALAAIAASLGGGIAYQADYFEIDAAGNRRFLPLPLYNPAKARA